MRRIPRAKLRHSGNDNGALIFVHGFGDTAENCWKTFFTLLDEDARFADDFTLDTYSYETEWFNFNPIQRVASLRDLGSAFGNYLQLKFAAYPRWILVGHSQGGLVIESYLVQKTREKAGADLAKVRSVVLFATPNEGSDIFSGIRKIAFSLSPNPQERTLRVLNPEIGDIQTSILRDVINATSVTDTTCSIAFQAFWGVSNAVVPEASARGQFLEASGLTGDHLSIIRPPKADDDRYRALCDALLNPVGHPKIFEIDTLEVRLEVAPFPSAPPYRAQYGSKTRKITTDNRARRFTNVMFGVGNRCYNQYEISYRTKDDGFVRFLTVREPNEAGSEAQSRYLELGTDLLYKFTPKPREQKVWMDLEIYKGFEAGNRNWHNHVPSNNRCRAYRFTLDLTAYLNAGFTVSKEPEFFWSGIDVDHDDEIEDQRFQQTAALRIEPAQRGVWVWQLEDFRGGVVDLDWDVASAPPQRSRARSGLRPPDRHACIPAWTSCPSRGSCV